MGYFAWLAKAVGDSISQKRIGTPVSLRALFYLSPDHGVLLPALGEALAAAGRWFGNPALRVYALGSIQAGEITVLVEYAGGQTALVSVGTLRDPSPLADLILIGNRGTVRYQERPEFVADPGRGDPKLLQAVEKSLAGQVPVEVGQ